MKNTVEKEKKNKGTEGKKLLYRLMEESKKNLGFVSPCIFIHSNKLIPTRCSH
jgi:hypothetical protein